MDANMKGKNNQNFDNNVQNSFNLRSVQPPNNIRNAIAPNGINQGNSSGQNGSNNNQQWNESSEQSNYSNQWTPKDHTQAVVPHTESSSGLTCSGGMPDTSQPPPSASLLVPDTSQPPPPVVPTHPPPRTDVTKPPPVLDVSKPPPSIQSRVSETTDVDNAVAQSQWNLLHKLWTFVQGNPYDFPGWSDLLSHVEAMGDIATARSAFEGFLPLFPYCFAYWKKFAELEKKSTNLKRYLGLLIYGVKAIPMCQELWIPLVKNFIQYTKENNISQDLVRGMYSMGLERIGYSWHSAPYWELCIGYEISNDNLQNAMTIYKSAIQIPNKVYNKHWDKMIALVRDNPLKALLLPKEFTDLEDICKQQIIKDKKDETIFNDEHKDKHEEQLVTLMKEKLVTELIKTHERIVLESEKRCKFEEKIKRPYFHVKPLDKKQLKVWNDYLDYEIREGDPVRILTLFERCLISCAQYEDMWCRYANFMENHAANVLQAKYHKVTYKPGCFQTTDTPPSSPDPFAFTLDYDVMDFRVSSHTQQQVATLVDDLCEDVNVGGRVLMCPALSHHWILQGVTFEDVRQVYRRGSWIHCPSKPKLLMQWAEFEESQGDLPTARDLLTTVLSKHPLLLQARLQVIELERRANMLDLVDKHYSQAFALIKEPKCRSLIAIRYARFLFKIRDQNEQPLVILRKALKKDKGNIHLYQHVFDICYQRHPVDTNGVLAAVMLALSSKELKVEDKYELCVKRQEFLKEHGTIQQIKECRREMCEVQRVLDNHKAQQLKQEKDQNKQQEKAKHKKHTDDKQHKMLQETQEFLRKALDEVEEKEMSAFKQRKRRYQDKHRIDMEECVSDEERHRNSMQNGFNPRDSRRRDRTDDMQRGADGHRRRSTRALSPRRSRHKSSKTTDHVEDDHCLDDERPNGNGHSMYDNGGNFQAPPAMGQGVLGDAFFNPDQGCNVGVFQMPDGPPPMISNFNDCPPPNNHFMRPPNFQNRPPGMGPPGLPPRMRMRPPGGIMPDFSNKRLSPSGAPISEPPNKMMRFVRPNRPPPPANRPPFAFNPPRMPPMLPNVNCGFVNVPEWLVKEGGELKLGQGPNGPAVIHYWPCFMTEMGHDTLFNALRKMVQWYPQKVQLKNGTWVDLEMLVSWLGPCDFKKNGITLQANTQWPQQIVDLLHVLIRACKMDSQFNSCLMRLYRHGLDSSPWDTEEHPAMNTSPKIATITLGRGRTIEMRHKKGPEYLKFPLLPGSLLFMEGATQTDWLQQIPKDSNVKGESISLSFRTMLMIQGLTV